MGRGLRSTWRGSIALFFGDGESFVEGCNWNGDIQAFKSDGLSRVVVLNIPARTRFRTAVNLYELHILPDKHNFLYR